MSNFVYLSCFQNVLDFLNENLIDVVKSIPTLGYISCACFIVVVFIVIGRYKDYKSKHNFYWYETNFENDEKIKNTSGYEKEE